MTENEITKWIADAKAAGHLHHAARAASRMRGLKMRTYYCTAEHTSGQSVDHPCTRGVYSDPTDQFDETIEAPDQAEAERIAYRRLAAIVEEFEPCHCRRKLQPGSDSWWNSVCIRASRVPYPDFLDDDGLLVVRGEMIESDDPRYAEELENLGLTLDEAVVS